MNSPLPHRPRPPETPALLTLRHTLPPPGDLGPQAGAGKSHTKQSPQEASRTGYVGNGPVVPTGVRRHGGEEPKPRGQPSRALPEPLVWGTPTLRLPPPHPLPRPPLRPSQWCSSRELAFDSPACCPLTASSPVPRGCPLTDLHRKPIPSCSHFAFEVAAGNPGADRPAAGGADQPALSSKEQGQGHRAQGAQPDHPQAPCHPCA